MSVSIALALTIASHPVATIPQPARFDDWIASCDNGRECQVLASSEDWSKDYWTVNIQRKAQRDARPIVSIWPRFEDVPGAIEVRIDGNSPSFAFDALGFLIGDPTDFLRAIARGTEAQIINAKGEVIGLLPTQGASAALRWVDDMQEREDTLTAIVARGPKPQSRVPTPPKLPTIATPPISNAVPKKLGAEAISEIKEAGECRSPLPWEDEFFRLDADHTLGLIACGLGAYQGSSMVVIIDEEQNWRPAKLEQPRDWAKEYGSTLPWLTWSVTTASYIADDQLLTSFAKGRGLGDCGSASSWAWDGEVFRLASHSEMIECRGTPPGLWPTLWRTSNSDAAFAG